MDYKKLRKLHPELLRLCVRHTLKYGENPIPQKDKNYIISIVSESRRCFVVLEYNDGWYAEDNQDINIPSREVLSFANNTEISENNFISLLIDIVKIYSTDKLNNQVVICNRTNGAGRVVFDAMRKEIHNMLSLENIQFFPTSRRSKYGKDIFKAKIKRLSQGWEMTVLDEKNCFDAMRTAQEQAFFTLATDKSKQMFDLISFEEQLSFEPFFYCWSMLSFIRLSAMNLFN